VTAATYGVAAWLLLIGIWGVITSRHLVHLVICLGVAQASTYVLLLGVGYRTHAVAPIYSTTVKPGDAVVDPVVQALTLTDVVVQATVTAVLLALTVQAHKRFGTDDPDELGELRG
jgi:multicomponent Na+:H+ antiporter subunit C